MTEHDEEAGMLQVHVDISVDEGVASQFLPAFFVFLYGKLVQLGAEVGSIIFGKHPGVGTQFDGQLMGEGDEMYLYRKRQCQRGTDIHKG